MTAAPAVNLRPGRVGDLPALRELTWRLTLANPAYAPQALARPEAVQGPDQALAEGGVVVAEMSGRPVGYVAILKLAAIEAEVDGLFVDAGSQGTGFGRRLLKAAEMLARDAGVRTLSVVSAPDAVVVYEACGFRPVGPAETPFGPATMLRLDLSADLTGDIR